MCIYTYIYIYIYTHTEVHTCVIPRIQTVEHRQNKNKTQKMLSLIQIYESILSDSPYLPLYCSSPESNPRNNSLLWTTPSLYCDFMLLLRAFEIEHFPTHTHRHTLTHSYTHRHTQTHRHTDTQLHTDTTHTDTQLHTDTQYTQTHTDTHRHTVTHRHTQTHTDTHRHTDTHTLSLSLTHTHTHTHTCWFLRFTGTFHRRNGCYTVQAVCAIDLHLPYT